MDRDERLDETLATACHAMKATGLLLTKPSHCISGTGKIELLRIKDLSGVYSIFGVRSLDPRSLPVGF